VNDVFDWSVVEKVKTKSLNKSDAGDDGYVVFVLLICAFSV